MRLAAHDNLRLGSSFCLIHDSSETTDHCCRWAAMLFNSLAFIVFLPVVLVLYRVLARGRQNILLLVASYVFYGWWDYRFCGLLAVSTFVDYFCARSIEASEDPAKRRGILAISLVTNLGILGFFKYFNFFADSAVELLQAIGLNASVVTLNVILPVGISFYTFQTLSYTIDIYKRNSKTAASFLDFAVYVSFFPQLVAGPIERATRLLPQIEQQRRVSSAQISDGLFLILVGYLKKLVIADRCSPIVTAAFSGSALPTDAGVAWLALYAFAFQIYGDFSGYTDIARGVSKLFGFELMRNFRAPYLVTNPAAFWRNWHISLSTWLRDYLYIPLGGNRQGPSKTYRNLMTTMLLGGLWHGAGWAYLLWGLYQGLILVVFRRAARRDVDKPWQPLERVVHGLVVLGFFHVTCIGWLIFRTGSISPGFSQAAFVYQSMASLVAPVTLSAIAPALRVLLIIGSVVFLVQWKNEALENFSLWPPARQAVAAVVIAVAIVTLGVFDGADFIYFQF